MKSRTICATVSVLGFALIGCDDNNAIYDPIPATPQGVYSVTGDRAVYVYFNGIYERDVREYIVYRSLEPRDNYSEVGRVQALANPNLDLIIYEFADNNLTNGVTYYYAAAAVDRAGQVSDPSAEEVFDTPRPQGQTVLFPNSIEQSLSGFSFEGQHQVHDTSRAADVYVDIFDDVYYLNVRDTLTDIQDMGYTAGFDDVSYAPADGWSVLGFSELIVGHTYVIWTRDSHYAKLRVRSFNLSGSASFDWAYQTDQDNPELVAPPGETAKPAHGPGYLRHKAVVQSRE